MVLCVHVLCTLVNIRKSCPCLMKLVIIYTCTCIYAYLYLRYDQFLQVLDVVASMDRSHAKVAVCRALYIQAYATVKWCASMIHHYLMVCTIVVYVMLVQSLCDYHETLIEHYLQLMLLFSTIQPCLQYIFVIFLHRVSHI